MLSYFKDGVMIEYTEAKKEATVDNFESAAAEFDDDIQFTYCTEFIIGRNIEDAPDRTSLDLIFRLSATAL